jgi:hypothetical protein
VQNYQLHLTQILLSILTTPIQLYDIEVSHIKAMEKKLKRRQEDEGKQECWREDKEMKENKKIKRREPKSRRWKWQTSPLRNLSIQLVKPSLIISLSYFAKCLTLLNNLENPHQSLSPWLSHSLHPYQANFLPQSFDYVVLNGVFMLCYFLSYSCTESYVCWLREVQSLENSKASVTLVHKFPDVLLCM